MADEEAKWAALHKREREVHQQITKRYAEFHREKAEFEQLISREMSRMALEQQGLEEKVEKQRADNRRARERELLGKAEESANAKRSPPAKKNSGRIVLDVGGQRFTTSVDTLIGQPDSLLAEMFTGDFERESDGSVFIDRDPKAFEIILEWLRNPTKLPQFADKKADRKKGKEHRLRHTVVAEARYFRLYGLLRALGEDASKPDNAGIQDVYQNLVAARPSAKAARSVDPPARSLEIDLAFSFGSQGSDPGQFERILGMCIRDDEIFVVDRGNRRIQVLDRFTGRFLRSLSPPDDQLRSPWGLAIRQIGQNRRKSSSSGFSDASTTTDEEEEESDSSDSNRQEEEDVESSEDELDDEIFVTDCDAGCVRVLDPATGELLKSFGIGFLSFPLGIAIDEPNDEVFVADCVANRVVVFGASAGEFKRRLGSQGVSHGKFDRPIGIALHRTSEASSRCKNSKGAGNASAHGPPAQNEIFVSEYGNGRVQVLRAADGAFGRKFGVPGDADGQMNRPYAISLVHGGRMLFVTELEGHRVDIFDCASGDYLGRLGDGSEGGGGGCQLTNPRGIAADEDGWVYVADSDNHRVQVFRVIEQD